MQLVYFWIEKNGVLENQGINFNSGFYFEMKKDDDIYVLERKREKEKEIPKSFFGEKIENISCIIGDNGGGKTTLIRAIINSKYTREIIKKYILVYEDSGKFYIKKNIEKIDIKFIFENIERNMYVGNKYIYFNTEVLNQPINYITNVFDISLGNEIYSTVLERALTDKEIIKKWVNEWGGDILLKTNKTKHIRRAEFLLKNKKIIDNIPYQDFKKKLLDIYQKREIIVEIKDEITVVKNYDNLFYLEFFNKIGDISDNLCNNLLKIMWSYIAFEAASYDTKKEVKEIINKKIKKREEKEELKIWFNNNLKIIKELEEINLSKKNYGFYEKEIVNISELEEMQRIIEVVNNKQKRKINSRTFTIPISNSKSSNIYTELVDRNIRIVNKIFNFEVGTKLSNGESLFLDLIIKLHNLKLNIELNGELKSVILFLEELESFMHPEWQRKIIKFLIFLKDNIKWMKSIDVQFILTSHTPFIISDLPEKNINFIRTGQIIRNEKSVFGGNIYNLLKEQFLMESCFGEFSKEKIKKVVNLLSKDENNNYKEIEIEKNKEEIEFVIDSIGEDLIRNKLKKMYDNYKEYKKNSRQKINSADIEEIRKLMESKGILIDDLVNELK